MLVRNLLRRKVRTALTLLGIAVGIASIVALVALSQGIAENYAEMTNRTSADITLQAVQGQGQAMTFGTGIDESLITRLRPMPEVKAAWGMLYVVARVPGVPFFLVYGYEPDQAGVKRFKVTEGISLAENRTRLGGKPILLGKVAADKLKKSVGDTVRLEETTFRIIGIYETGAAMEDSGGLLSLNAAQTLANMPRQVMFIGAQLRHPEQADAFKAKLARSLPGDVEIAGTQAGNTMIEMLEMFDYFAWGVALIAALVGGVGMMNTMLMSVFERTREIGVLRAVGWSRWRVLRMIMGESLLLSCVGGLVGLGSGASLVWLAAHSPAMAGLTHDTVPPSLVAQAFSLALLLGVVGGAYPAWYASGLSPVEALSYDGSSRKRQVRNLPFGGMALKNLWRQRTRTALTLVGVGIGVLAIVMMGGLTQAMIDIFGDMVSGAEISVAERDQPDTSLSVIDERALKRIEATSGVKSVSGMLFAVVNTPDQPFFVIIARTRTDPMFSPRVLKEGALLNGNRQCLLGWKAAAEIKKGVGDRISMLGTSFKIVGIVEMGNAWEDNGAIIELREAQQLLKKPRQVMLAQIKLQDPRDTDAMLARLSAEYPKLLFTQSAELAESLPDMQTSESMINAIFVLTALVGSIALMNTMIMSIYERTREIGVLRAVGWQRGMVLRQVLAESVLVTLLSGVAGIIGALLLSALLHNAQGIGFMGEMLTVPPTTVAQALVLCVVLGGVGGLYPAWRATRFSPVEALRYE